jgi:hypothetical protein
MISLILYPARYARLRQLIFIISIAEEWEALKSLII